MTYRLWLLGTGLLLTLAAAFLSPLLLVLVALVFITMGAIELREHRSRMHEVSPEVADNMAVQLKRQVDGIRRTVIYDGTVGLYQSWYFDLRIEEERRRSLRYALSMAVIVVKVGEPTLANMAEDSWNVEATQAAYEAARAVRTVDLAATVGQMEIGICLVHCDLDGARVAMSRLARDLQKYDCLIGSAVLGEEKEEAKELLVLARRRMMNAADLAQYVTARDTFSANRLPLSS